MKRVDFQTGKHSAGGAVRRIMSEGISREVQSRFKGKFGLKQINLRVSGLNSHNHRATLRERIPNRARVSACAKSCQDFTSNSSLRNN